MRRTSRTVLAVSMLPILLTGCAASNGPTARTGQGIYTGRLQRGAYAPLCSAAVLPTADAHRWRLTLLAQVRSSAQIHVVQAGASKALAPISWNGTASPIHFTGSPPFTVDLDITSQVYEREIDDPLSLTVSPSAPLPVTALCQLLGRHT